MLWLGENHPIYHSAKIGWILGLAFLALYLLSPVIAVIKFTLQYHELPHRKILKNFSLAQKFMSAGVIAFALLYPVNHTYNPIVRNIERQTQEFQSKELDRLVGMSREDRSSRHHREIAITSPLDFGTIWFILTVFLTFTLPLILNSDRKTARKAKISLAGMNTGQDNTISMPTLHRMLYRPPIAVVAHDRNRIWDERCPKRRRSLSKHPGPGWHRCRKDNEDHATTARSAFGSTLRRSSLRRQGRCQKCGLRTGRGHKLQNNPDRAQQEQDEPLARPQP